MPNRIGTQAVSLSIRRGSGIFGGVRRTCASHRDAEVDGPASACVSPRYPCSSGFQLSSSQHNALSEARNRTFLALNANRFGTNAGVLSLA